MEQEHWDPDSYDHHARFVSRLGRDVLAWLDPQPGEIILDLGCGDGALTAGIEAVGATVVGVDTSSALLHGAQSRGLTVMWMDGHDLKFENQFSAVFSNAAIHWMTRPGDVIAGVWRALQAGGRFVGECGGSGNVQVVHQALREARQRRGLPPIDPWYFPTPDAYASLLQEQGFEVERIELFPRPTPLDTGIAGWLRTFAAVWLADSPNLAEQEAMLGEVVRTVQPHLYDPESQRWVADYVRLRFLAHKPNLP